MNADDSATLPAGSQCEPVRGSAASSCVLTCLVAALVAGWLTLGDMQRLNHADSLIPAFASLYRWTWFYWGQNRFGMLTALLAMPIHHPLMNLLFQNWIVSFCGLMAFPLFHGYLSGWRTAPLSGLVGAALFLLCGPDCLHMDYLLANQPYAVSGCLGFLGLLAIGCGSAGRFRVALQLMAMGLLFLCFWVSLAAVFLIVPLFTLQSLLGPARGVKRARAFLTGLPIIIVAALANWVVLINTSSGERYGWTPLYAWPGNCASLVRNVYQVTPAAFLIGLLALAGTGTLACLMCRHREGRTQMLRALLISVLAALFYCTAAAASDHVRQSEFAYRYAIPPIVLLVASAAMFATMPAHPLPPRWRAGLGAVLLLGLFAGTTLRYGTPSCGRVRGIIDQRFGGPTNAILENQCTHVMGNYWDVWGAVFHANLTQYESGSPNVIWGITTRSEVTRDLWFPLLNRSRIAVVRSADSDLDWQKQAEVFQLPSLRLDAETPQIRVFVLER